MTGSLWPCESDSCCKQLSYDMIFQPCLFLVQFFILSIHSIYRQVAEVYVDGECIQTTYLEWWEDKKFHHLAQVRVPLSSSFLFQFSARYSVSSSTQYICVSCLSFWNRSITAVYLHRPRRWLLSQENFSRAHFLKLQLRVLFNFLVL